jgi:3'-phosphoadenosine 5'-phosphosulfate sulfotransferase (PAPS reductase)/FAD synthetase
MEEKELYVLSFSGGRTSAYMTDSLLKMLPASSVLVCFANTGKEELATLDFVRQCDEHWGDIIKWLEYDPVERFRIVSYETAARAGEPFEALIEKRNYLPNVVARICTQDLKVRVIKRFIQSLGYKHWTSAIGIRYDEPRRWSKTRGIAEKECWDIWLPLVDWKVTKPMVLDFWRKMPFDLQLQHHEGNCDLCFLKGKNKLKRILTAHPEKAEWWIRQEQKVQGTFHKEYSYQQFLDLLRRTPTLFDYEDDDFECFCNVD